MSNNQIENNLDGLTPLVQVIQELTQVISEEITLLKTNRPGELTKLLPLKNKMMELYEREMTALNNRGGLKSFGNGEAIRVLKRETNIFQSVLTQHTRLIKALKKISEDMIRSISDEIIKSQNQSSRYGANGSKSAPNSPTSITLNRTV